MRPLDGVVIWRYADTGALIQGGTNSNSQDLPIVRISQSKLLRLRVPVPEDDVRFIHVGDALEVRVDAIDRSFTGKIVRFTRDVNFETRTMETEIDVENQQSLHRSGHVRQHHAAARARKQRRHHSRGSAGAARAARRRSTCSTAPITFTFATSASALRAQKLAEITSGLEPGDRVILGGQDKYQEGEAVNPLMTPGTGLGDRAARPAA